MNFFIITLLDATYIYISKTDFTNITISIYKTKIDESIR